MILPTREINVLNRFTIGGNQRFTLIAGPCAIENEKITRETASTLKQISEELNIHLIFKSSFDKANRTSIKSSRGIGMERGLQILQQIKEDFDLPILTDVHGHGNVKWLQKWLMCFKFLLFCQDKPIY